MPITDSIITEDIAQDDGRRWVTEEHVYTTGETDAVTYMAEADADAAAIAEARVPLLEEQRAAQETRENTAAAAAQGSQAPLNLDHSSQQQNVDALQMKLDQLTQERATLDQMIANINAQLAAIRADAR